MGNGKPNSETGTIEGHDIAHPKENDTQNICPLGALRAVTQRTDQDEEKKGDV
jgi:hypothetical protein